MQANEVPRYASPRYSVIVPTLNEEDHIGLTVRHVRKLNPKAQVIVVDGGSVDNTAAVARQAGATVVQSQQGRGIQCNVGAKIADGDILLFLHADVTLPENTFRIIASRFTNPELSIGSFRLGFDEHRFLLSVYSWFSQLDTTFTRFGDQCLVMRRSFFHRLGGFKNWQAFEDVDFLRRARRVTTVHSFPAHVTASARKFRACGLVRTQLISAWLILKFICGADPDRLANQYRTMDQRRSPSRIRVALRSVLALLGVRP